MERYRDEFKDKLSKIKGITTPADYRGRSVGIPMEKWMPIADEFVKVVQDLIK